MQERIALYFETLARLPLAAEVTDARGRTVPLHAFFTVAIARMRATHAAGNKIMFVGNGGSAAIASHFANDFSKNGGMRACCFTDGSALTCLGNDYGYEFVYAKQIEMHARAGDLLIAISSSGNSKNILNAVDAARNAKCGVVTFSGFRPDNKLRALGDHNVYVGAEEYGFVEVTHEALIHAVLDIACGWGRETSDNNVGDYNKRLSA
ncbi:MAG TPA: SIS domain-containing protein [Candidatus Cybelea sp.]|nr:SIS domain-containing protein [Candidatus Cybelea sp.]